MEGRGAAEYEELTWYILGRNGDNDVNLTKWKMYKL